MKHRAIPLAIVMLFGAGALFPCGGPAVFNLSAPLVPIPEFASDLLYPYDGYEAATDQRLRFLHGLSLADSAALTAVAALADARGYHTDTTATDNAPVSSDALEEAIAADDLPTAEREARRIIDALLQMPAPMATNGQRALRRATELLDYAPTLRAAPSTPIGRTLASSGAEVRHLQPTQFAPYATAHPLHPRIAVIRMRAMHAQMTARIPDGWLDEIRTAMPTSAWDSLHAEHARWIADFPAHPLAPLVQAERVRLWYLAGDRHAAWWALLTMYQTLPARAAYEMRFLLAAGFFPPEGTLTDVRVPAEIRASLIGTLVPSKAEWGALWQLAQQRSSRRFGANLELRLLAATALDSTMADGTLPRDFPAYRPEAELAWRQLWATSQLRAGHGREALRLAEPAHTDTTGISGRILARAHLQQRHFAAAALAPGLVPEARRYLLQVIVADSVLDAVRASADTGAQRDAALALSARRAARGDWGGGAAVLADIDPRRAARFRAAAVLAADTSITGTVAFARWLTQQKRTLLVAAEEDILWYRSVNWQRRRRPQDTEAAAQRGETDLPWTVAEEQPRIEAHFRATFEDWYALQLYRTYFARTTRQTPGRMAVVRDADAAYRRLVDYGTVDGLFWRDVLPTSPEAVAIRQAGRRR